MQRALERAYFAKDVRRLEVLEVPAVLLEVLKLHWQGKLAKAHAAAERIAPGELTRSFDELSIAERALLSVKLGLAQAPRERDPKLKTGMARLIWQYAHFSHYFWVDQRRAWRSLRELFWSSVRVPRSGMLLTVLFLMGHLAAIAGFSRVGYPLAAAAYRCCCSRRRRLASSAFARNIVFAAFPYTCLISGKLGKLERVARSCQRRLSPDPYYTTIFLVSALYSAAYTGDVVRAEILAAHLRELQRRGTMHRYHSVAQIAPLLPLAFRGYSHLVERELEAIVAEHRPAETDAIVNSQFYRMAALVAVSIGHHEGGLDCIERAIAYRKQSRSFHVWHAVDGLIRDQATQRIRFDPSRHRLFGVPLRFEAPAALGTLLMEAVSLLPAAYSGGLADFEDWVFELLKRHIACPAAEVRASPGQLLESNPQIRVGSRYLVFHGLDRQRIPAVERLLSSIAPVFSIMFNGVREVLAAKAENERVSREAAIARVTQMLAHDVRQPFRMLEAGIAEIRRARDAVAIQRTVERLLPDLEVARATVDGLIADVMEIGSNTPPRCEPVAPELLVEDAVRDLVRGCSAADVTLDYDFSHTRRVLVDDRKVRRVFANISSNALQAIGERGRIWYGAHDASHRGQPCVEFVIGNTGPVIAPEDVPRIFDAFFTKGKSMGTGLGLAIAHRVVVAHGGQIDCCAVDAAPAQAGGVEFRFTLPAEEAPYTPRAVPLPRHVGTPVQRPVGARSPALPELALVDDSRVFLTQWRAAVQERVLLHFFCSPEAFWAAVEREPGLLGRLRAIITDYRFSNSPETGASFATALHARAGRLPVLLSSSGVFSEREVARTFDGVLDKGAISWNRLVETLEPLVGLAALAPGATITPALPSDRWRAAGRGRAR